MITQKLGVGNLKSFLMEKRVSLAIWPGIFYYLAKIYSQICEYIKLKCYFYNQRTNDMVVTFDKEY